MYFWEQCRPWWNITMILWHLIWIFTVQLGSVSSYERFNWCNFLNFHWKCKAHWRDAQRIWQKKICSKGTFTWFCWNGVIVWYWPRALTTCLPRSFIDNSCSCCIIQKWAGTCNFQQCGNLTSVDSGEHVQLPFELKNFKWSSLTLIESGSIVLPDRIYKRQAKALISLHVCAGWSEPFAVVGNLMSQLNYTSP